MDLRIVPESVVSPSTDPCFLECA